MVEVKDGHLAKHHLPRDRAYHRLLSHSTGYIYCRRVGTVPGKSRPLATGGGRVGMHGAKTSDQNGGERLDNDASPLKLSRRLPKVQHAAGSLEFRLAARATLKTGTIISA